MKDKIIIFLIKHPLLGSFLTAVSIIVFCIGIFFFGYFTIALIDKFMDLEKVIGFSLITFFFSCLWFACHNINKDILDSYTKRRQEIINDQR